MKITQDMVNRIVARARESDVGLGEGLTHKQGHLRLDQYAEPNLNALGMLLVNAYDAKYDLISIFVAALEVVAQEASAAPSNAKAKASIDSVKIWSA